MRRLLEPTSGNKQKTAAAGEMPAAAHRKGSNISRPRA